MATKLTLVAGATALVTTRIIDMVKEAQSLRQAMLAVNTDMSDFNKRTDGMINTLDGLQGAIKLQNAGLQLTAKEFGTVGAAAANMAQELGEGPDGMTTRFNRLVKALASGRETAFKELGIEIENTSDLVEFQKEAIEKLVAKYGDLSVEAQTAEERMFAFNNSLDTVNSALVAGFVERAEDAWKQFNLTIFGGVDALMAYEEEILATDGAIAEWDTSITGVINKINRLGATMADHAVAVAAFFGVDISDSYLVGQLGRNAQLAEIERLEEVKRGMQAKKRRDAEEQARARVGGAAVNALSRRTGRGGARRGATDDIDMDFTLAGIVDEELSDITGPTVDQRLLMQGQDTGVDPLNLESIFEQKEAMMGAEVDAFMAAEAEKTAILEAEMARRQALQASYVDGVSNLMDSLAQLSNDGSKEGFEASKAFAYSANIVNTLVASMAAVKNALEFGGPAGIALAAIQSAAVMAQGAATGRRIRQQKYQKGSTSGGATGPSVASFNTGSMGAGGGTDGGDNFTFNINVEGQTIQSSVIRANDIASQNGQRSFAMSEA
jgi:hypothetical protein